MKTEYQKFLKALLETLEGRLECEERETDIFADHFDEAENRHRYAEIIKEKDLRFSSCKVETIADALACTYYYETIPGCIYGPYDFNEEKGIILDSAAIQETEEQFCFDDDLSFLSSASPELIRLFFQLAEKQGQICATLGNRQALVYQATDAVWFAVISFSALDELYKDLTEG